jgi:hypothetical protein
LIRYFREAQDIGVAAVVNTLRLPIPKSGSDWSLYCCANGIQRVEELNGIPIYAHGFGIELKIGKLTIDFDWGPNGEDDGFDAWRLYNFTLDNDTGVECTHGDVIRWIQDAYSNGELERIDHMYFDPHRRSESRRIDEQNVGPKPPSVRSEL